MRVIIVGCGRIGAGLASQLAEAYPESNLDRRYPIFRTSTAPSPRGWEGWAGAGTFSFRDTEQPPFWVLFLPQPGLTPIRCLM